MYRFSTRVYGLTKRSFPEDYAEPGDYISEAGISALLNLFLCCYIFFFLKEYSGTTHSESWVIRLQVHELHRIYGMQKTLMQNISWMEFDQYDLNKVSTQPSLLPCESVKSTDLWQVEVNMDDLYRSATNSLSTVLPFVVC